MNQNICFLAVIFGSFYVKWIFGFLVNWFYEFNPKPLYLLIWSAKSVNKLGLEQSGQSISLLCLNVQNMAVDGYLGFKLAV